MRVKVTQIDGKNAVIEYTTDVPKRGTVKASQIQRMGNATHVANDVVITPVIGDIDTSALPDDVAKRIARLKIFTPDDKRLTKFFSTDEIATLKVYATQKEEKDEAPIQAQIEEVTVAEKPKRRRKKQNIDTVEVSNDESKHSI